MSFCFSLLESIKFLLCIFAERLVSLVTPLNRELANLLTFTIIIIINAIDFYVNVTLLYSVFLFLFILSIFIWWLSVVSNSMQPTTNLVYFWIFLIRFSLACKASTEESSSKQSPLAVKYDRLPHSDVQQSHTSDQFDSSDISQSISTSSDDDFTANIKASLAVAAKPFQRMPLKSMANHQPANKMFGFSGTICSDLRLSARKSINKAIIPPMRPRLPPKRMVTPPPGSRGSQISGRLPEKRQSDPQIRYAFYNKGFEAAAATRHRKLSLSHEFRRRAMPNITECGSIERVSDTDDDAYDDDITNYTKSFTHPYKPGDGLTTSHPYSSSGRDITLLPKLKIRICDEMGKNVQHSFDESSSSDENSSSKTDDDWFRTDFNETNTMAHISTDPFKTVTTSAASSMTTATSSVAMAPSGSDDSDDFLPKCKKCGHKFPKSKLQKQFSTSFT